MRQRAPAMQVLPALTLLASLRLRLAKFCIALTQLTKALICRRIFFLDHLARGQRGDFSDKGRSGRCDLPNSRRLLAVTNGPSTP